MKKSTQPKEEMSKGTVIAEKARERMNSYGDQRRQELLDRGLALIYGGPNNQKQPANRG